MIGLLRGVVASVAAEQVVLDVNGVGYVVDCALTTMERLPVPRGRGDPRGRHSGERGTRSAYSVSFPTSSATGSGSSRGVQGIGAKVALRMLGIMSPTEVGRAIVAGDAKAVARTQGVGPKLAARVVAELKDKAGPLLARTSDDGRPVPAVGALPPEAEDAVGALVNLGYQKAFAADAVSKVLQEVQGASTQSLIRHALRHLSR